VRPWLLSALEPVDSDVDLGDPVQRRELRRHHGLVVAVIAAGRVLGALLRFQLGVWWPAAPPGFPWTTLTINLSGSLVLGAFMVLLTERWDPHPLTRPFFGTGVLSGYTTFSTFTVDIVLLLRDGHTATASGYVLATMVGALITTVAGMSLAHRMFAGTRSLLPGPLDPDLNDPDEDVTTHGARQPEHR